VHGSELAPLVSSFVLRAQSQAVYSPSNIGHFGLNLGRYAHFTSPILRYSDLVVHRALIRGLGLGEGGLEEVSGDAFAELGSWISRTERRAMEAERAALNRFVALYMEAHIGAEFTGTVVSVQRFGLFVQLDETGADGLIPVSELGGGWWTHDPTHHALLGERAGEAMGLGDRVKVELKDADSLTGQISFRLLDHTQGPAAAAALRAHRKPQRPQRQLRGRRARR
jgi:ribonuclease R